MYYHPALLEADEAALRKQYMEQSAAHDKIDQAAAAGMFVAFWPITHTLSKSVKPVGCAFFAAAWFVSYFKVVKPFTLN